MKLLFFILLALLIMPGLAEMVMLQNCAIDTGAYLLPPSDEYRQLLPLDKVSNGSSLFPVGNIKISIPGLDGSLGHPEFDQRPLIAIYGTQDADS
jgi:hypothetical protein